MLVSYVQRFIAPPSIELDSKKKLERFCKSSPETPVVIAFPSSDSDPFFEAYNDVARTGLGGLPRFAHSFDPALASQYGLEQGSVGIFIPKVFRSEYEPAVVSYTGSWERENREVLESVREAVRPLVGLRNNRNRQLYEDVFPRLVAYLSLESEDGEMLY